MKKLIGLSLLVVGFLAMAGRAEAAGAARGSKSAFALRYTTTVSTVSLQPATVYGVVLASGAASEFIALFNTNSAGAKTANTNDSTLMTRVLFSSTSANTVVAFDPPMYFSSGVMVGDSAVTGLSTIIFEPGKNIAGN